jgi:lipid-A-disaccharide synthase-like uncharacterized protein
MKWEPAAAMVGLILLGFWLVYAPSVRHDLRDGAQTVPLTIGTVKGYVEIVGEPGEETFRMLLRGEPAGQAVTHDEFIKRYGEAFYVGVTGIGGNPVFRVLNITRWGSLAWVTIGFAGQIAFFGRMMVQWLASERKGESVVPPMFWWLSLFGGVTLFTYFVWRQDVIGVLGQSSGVVIYARNIRLIYKSNKRERQRAEKQAARGGRAVDVHGDPAPEPTMEMGIAENSRSSDEKA